MLIEVKMKDKSYDENKNDFLLNVDNIIYLRKEDRTSGAKNELTQYCLHILFINSLNKEIIFKTKKERDTLYNKIKGNEKIYR